MKKRFAVIAVCLLILGTGAIFVTNAKQVYVYSGGSSGYNEEYDILYEDIADRYEQGIITMDEAEVELMELSRSAIITGNENNGEEIATASLDVSGSGLWEPYSGATPEPLRVVKVELFTIIFM